MQAFEPTNVRDVAATAWSCVLDDTPAMWDHFLIWIATLTACADVARDAIVVHHVTDLRPDVARLAARLGLRSRRVSRFDTRSPHCNKIVQCATGFADARRVVLTDVDVAFLVRPPVERLHAPVAGKPVDLANPPVDVLCDLFRHARLPLPRERVTVPTPSPAGAPTNFQTLPGNYNGGFYVIDQKILTDLGARWAYWARWLMDTSLMPAHYAIHVDQVAFCMAVHDLGLNVTTLDACWNLPSHMETTVGDAPPFVIHHHGQVDASLRLRPLRPPRHAVAIANANAVIGDFLHRHGIAATAPTP